MYNTDHHISIDWGDGNIRSERILWNREVSRRGSALVRREPPEAIGFAAAVRFLYERPADQPVFLFYDRGWGDQPGIRGTWEFCPIEGSCHNGQKPIVEVTRQAVWLLAKHGFLEHNTLRTFKARRIHDVQLRPEREWFFEHAAAIEAGHAAGVMFALRELKHDDAQRDMAKKRRDRRRRAARKAASLLHDVA